MQQLDKTDLPRTFGVFTPTGHVVMGFASDADMRAARDNMLAAGIPDVAITPFSSKEVVGDIEKMRSNASVVAPLMNESEMMDDHLKLAKEGGGFLVVYAPHEADTARAVDIAKQAGLRIAHKYNLLTLHRILE
jgi:hypothetical protein